MPFSIWHYKSPNTVPIGNLKVSMHLYPYVSFMKEEQKVHVPREWRNAMWWKRLKVGRKRINTCTPLCKQQVRPILSGEGIAKKDVALRDIYMVLSKCIIYLGQN